MKSICVYLGARTGSSHTLAQAAALLGEEIARRGLRLIYGGSSLGLMGILAQAVLDNEGQAIGIIPHTLAEQEKPLHKLNQLIITATMQERKLLMQQQADAFIVMPGGLGTLEEAFETWNAIKIGLIAKPLGFLNLDGFYDGLFGFIEHCEQQGFVSSSQRSLPIINSDPKGLLDTLFASRLADIPI